MVNPNIKTETGKPFALLQVPEYLMGDLVESPENIEKIRQIVGVDVLIISQNVKVDLGDRAVDEARQIHDEIEKYLDQPKDPADMTTVELADEIHRLVIKHREYEDRIGDLRKIQALQACPFKVGEILVDKKGQRAVIRNIGPHSWWGGDGYGMTGVYLKKDGTEGKRRCQFYNWDKWKKESEDAETES